ncbi:MAG TPA: hypothetical protein VIH40_13100, partial [Xanthobacteraceae bacterium]
MIQAAVAHHRARARIGGEAIGVLIAPDARAQFQVGDIMREVGALARLFSPISIMRGRPGGARRLRHRHDVAVVLRREFAAWHD